MPSAPTFTAVPMFRAPTGRVRISAQPQLDQARDRDASGQTDRHPGEQAPDQQPGQSLPRREQSLPHFHSAIDHDLYAGHVGALVTPVGHSSQSDRRYADRRGRRCGLQGHHRARARSNRTRKPRRDDVGSGHRGLRRTLGPRDRSRSRAHPKVQARPTRCSDSPFSSRWAFRSRAGRSWDADLQARSKPQIYRICTPELISVRKLMAVQIESSGARVASSSLIFCERIEPSCAAQRFCERTPRRRVGICSGPSAASVTRHNSGC